MTSYTKKQGQYLAFIHHYTKLHGIPPAEGDIEGYFQTTAPYVHQMIVKIEEKGFISKIPRTPRTIKVLLPPDQIPELGEEVSKEVQLKTIWSQESYLKAYRFAAKAHHDQKFPGTDLPYIMHISFVSMEIIAALNFEKDRDGDFAVQCSILHDVIEDTDAKYDEVRSAFGEKVAKGVLALTKDEELPKEDRMRDSLRRIRKQPNEIWMVKLAERIANLGLPPHTWSKERISQYRAEAIEIHSALDQASEYLSRRLIHKITEFGRFL